jgi:anthranilate synthase component II
MIAVIDNYDSFTYNLVQLLGCLAKDIEVFRNDEISVDELRARHPSRILISPGPGRPENAGICVDVIRTLGPEIPILGVCLGHQAIGNAFGGKIVHAPVLMHGKTSLIDHNSESLFRGVPNPFEATRYHSLVIERENFPLDLEITATTEDVIMAVRHKRYRIEGVQFHPESILTKEGSRLLKNWVEMQECK